MSKKYFVFYTNCGYIGIKASNEEIAYKRANRRFVIYGNKSSFISNKGGIVNEKEN